MGSTSDQRPWSEEMHSHAFTPASSASPVGGNTFFGILDRESRQHYDREASVQSIVEHGSFGPDAFANLDGEIVVVDSHVGGAR
jgi:hypothetical protein